MRFRLSSTLKRPKTLIKTIVYDVFSTRFHLSTLETESFQKDAFSEGSTFETVFISVFGHFSVHERQKRGRGQPLKLV